MVYIRLIKNLLKKINIDVIHTHIFIWKEYTLMRFKEKYNIYDDNRVL